METFDDLKDKWKKATPYQTLFPQDVIKNTMYYKKKQTMRIIYSIIMLIGTCLVMGYIFMNYEALYVTTYWGIGLAALAAIGAIIWQSLMVSFLAKPVDLLADNKAFLRHWQSYQRRLIWGQGIGISVYFILLSLGLALYLFEFAQRNWSYGIVFYLVTFVWIALNWFYFRPRIIKKQTAKLDSVLDEAKRISNQVEEA